MKVFYVCSYGGSGSTVLNKYLEKFGKSYHVHSRNPPDRLEYIGGKDINGKDVYFEWFNGIPISDDDYKNNEYYVIYIFRDPVKSIYSICRRFEMSNHLKNIQCPHLNAKRKDVINTKQDLYRLEEFFDNYTMDKKERNYRVICVKYECLFENLETLNEMLGIPNKPDLYPKKIEKNASDNDRVALEEVYVSLIDKINKMPPIKVITNGCSDS